MSEHQPNQVTDHVVVRHKRLGRAATPTVAESLETVVLPSSAHLAESDCEQWAMANSANEVVSGKFSI